MFVYCFPIAAPDFSIPKGWNPESIPALRESDLELLA